MDMDEQHRCFSFTALPMDLLHEILAYVSDLPLPCRWLGSTFVQIQACSIRDLLSISAVNRAIFELSRSHRYRKVVLDLDKFDRCKAYLATLKSNEEVQGYVKAITFAGNMHRRKSETFAEFFDDLTLFLTQYSRLQLTTFTSVHRFNLQSRRTAY